MTEQKYIFPENIKTAFDLLEKAGYKAYAVGGCVRDFIMGVTPYDFDIATSALPDEIIEVFNSYKINTNGIKHGTVRVIINYVAVEITTFRSDGEYNDFRHPDSVTFTRSIEKDLARRDFTVNAMAMDKAGNLIDLYGGMDDIKSKIIRCVGNPDERIKEDALRILRGLRFASKLGFEIENNTFTSFCKYKDNLNEISPDRVRAELSGLLLGKDAGRVLRSYKEIIFAVIPELKPCDGFDHRTKTHIYDVYTHITYVVENIECKPDLRFAALLHDIAKPKVFYSDKDGNGHYDAHGEIGADIALIILKRLNFSAEDKNTIYNLINQHDTFTKANKISVLQRIAKSSLSFYEKVVSMQIADNKSKAPNAYNDSDEYFDEILSLLTEIKNEKLCTSISELDIKGNDIASIGIEGCKIKKALMILLNAVITEKVRNKKDDLMNYLCKIKTVNGQMKDKKYIFFDLDGTLTDPATGITNSVIYSLERFGIHGKTKNDLLCFIGPPLFESYMKYFGMTHDEAVKAVEVYREYFGVTGLFENEVYEGIDFLLASLKNAGKTIILATSKPGVFADRILEHFDLMKYFDLTVGSELNGERINKKDIIKYAVDKLQITDISKCLMIGDKSHDIIGGKRNNMDTVGVTYGYGSFEELLNEGADLIVESVAELKIALLGE